MMPRGSKQRYTDRQKRQAAHIEQSELDAGRSSRDAKAIAWATVNKQDGGGQKTGGEKAPPKRARKKSADAK